MLQKMGWAEGKGLGANEDGPATHVRIKRRREQQGMPQASGERSKFLVHTFLGFMRRRAATLCLTHRGYEF